MFTESGLKGIEAWSVLSSYNCLCYYISSSATRCDTSYVQRTNMTYAYSNDQPSNSTTLQFGTLVTHKCNCGLHLQYNDANLTSVTRSKCWGNIGWFPRNVPYCTEGTSLFLWEFSHLWQPTQNESYTSSAYILRHWWGELYVAKSCIVRLGGKQHYWSSKDVQKQFKWSWSHRWNQNVGTVARAKSHCYRHVPRHCLHRPHNLVSDDNT